MKLAPIVKAIITAGELLYGERWRAPLAADLGYTDRTMQRWINGETTPTEINTLSNQLFDLMQQRAAALEAALPDLVELSKLN